MGSPDRNRGNVVKAFIVFKERHQGDEILAADIKVFVKNKLSKHEYPEEIEFISELPKTPDCKVKRKLLRDREQRNKTLTAL